MNFTQRLILLAAFLGCFAFLFAWAAGRSAKAAPVAVPDSDEPLRFWMATRESDELIVLRGDRILSGAELITLARRLNTNPIITHELAR